MALNMYYSETSSLVSSTLASAPSSTTGLSFLSLPILQIILAQIPKIKAQATSVIVTLPNETTIPPTPQIKITDTTNKFLLSPKSTSLIILRPDTAMKPYNTIHTPPITQLGIVASNVTNGAMNESTIHKIAVQKIVITEAFLEIATQPTDSP